MTTETGIKINEGKTKIIRQDPDKDGHVLIEAKDDITAGDGAKHDIMQGKAAIATGTTCNVFQLLKACGIPLAFVEQRGEETFVARKCTMLPYEVVVRGAKRTVHTSSATPMYKRGRLSLSWC